MLFAGYALAWEVVRTTYVISFKLSSPYFGCQSLETYFPCLGANMFQDPVCRLKIRIPYKTSDENQGATMVGEGRKIDETVAKSM